MKTEQAYPVRELEISGHSSQSCFCGGLGREVGSDEEHEVMEREPTTAEKLTRSVRQLH